MEFIAKIIALLPAATVKNITAFSASVLTLMPFWYVAGFLFSADFFSTAPQYVPAALSFCLALIFFLSMCAVELQKQQWLKWHRNNSREFSYLSTGVFAVVILAAAMLCVFILHVLGCSVSIITLLVIAFGYAAVRHLMYAFLIFLKQNSNNNE